MLVVFGQTAVPVEPAEGSFNDPAFRQDFEFVEFWAFDDFQNRAEHGLAPVNDTWFIASIDKDLEKMRHDEKPADQNPMRPPALGDARQMNGHGQNIAHHIHGDVAFATFRLLAAVIPTLPPFCTVFTDWLSMIPSVGSGERPAFTRTRLRNACMTLFP